MMDLYAAIELRSGKSRRALKRNGGTTTDPAEIARHFVDAGVAGLHIVDVDAKHSGESRNRVVIASIVREAGVPVQVDSGAVTRKAAEPMLDTGAERVVIDSRAQDEPGLIEWLALKYSERVVVAVGPDATVQERAARLGESGIALLTFAYRGRQDLGYLSDVLASTSAGVIALLADDATHDLEDLGALEIGFKRLDGVVVGGPLYGGPGRVRAALEICN